MTLDGNVGGSQSPRATFSAATRSRRSRRSREDLHSTGEQFQRTPREPRLKFLARECSHRSKSQSAVPQNYYKQTSQRSPFRRVLIFTARAMWAVASTSTVSRADDARHRLPPMAADASASAFAAAFGGDSKLLAAIRRQWQGPAATDDSDSAISRFDALGPVVQCPASLLQSFGEGDDEKRVCGGPVEAPCTVVSIGSNHQWGFERAVAAAGSCHIHTLDCTVAATVPPGLRSRVTFHPICLGEEDRTRA